MPKTTDASTPAFAELDLDDITVTPKAGGPPREALKALSHTTGFPSREPTTPAAPAAPPTVRGPRTRKRTGRTHTFSVKLKPETAERIYQIHREGDYDTVGEVIEELVAHFDAKP